MTDNYVKVTSTNSSRSRLVVVGLFSYLPCMRTTCRPSFGSDEGLLSEMLAFYTFKKTTCKIHHQKNCDDHVTQIERVCETHTKRNLGHLIAKIFGVAKDN